MDTLRGFDRNDVDAELDLSGFEDDVVASDPPPPVGQDERRMQVRAYNYWAGLLGQNSFPPVATLLDGVYPDFAENAVLLHFDEGIEDPAISFVGGKLAEECGTESSIARLSQVPGRSLLSRITDHYMQIIANQAPIGFEAEFVNQHGRTILYRGILLPFRRTARLHHGVTTITSPQAADALRPIAGNLAFAFFAIGIIGTGLLAVPVLAGAAAYAVAETFRWPEGLDRKPREAKAFYGVIALARSAASRSISPGSTRCARSIGPPWSTGCLPRR
ncbi:divalent metal cation transporter [Novosphingobium sp. MMS21-SN21R]|uniref:divalent metal cation transporter n=1 Tax=Novosphingobium sp. MMS21-SN21R TaxID=2969298 RepID=UPI0028850C6C|nr:divalent metal cation transporter [Novosphingobium sp. MMS21-SN21R]MDT0509485.1 divalent metal cation transporter [Novosphingobium sp. MMS21-SN21R]